MELFNVLTRARQAWVTRTESRGAPTPRTLSARKTTPPTLLSILHPILKTAVLRTRWPQQWSRLWWKHLLLSPCTTRTSGSAAHTWMAHVTVPSVRPAHTNMHSKCSTTSGGGVDNATVDFRHFLSVARWWHASWSRRTSILSTRGTRHKRLWAGAVARPEHSNGCEDTIKRSQLLGHQQLQ